MNCLLLFLKWVKWGGLGSALKPLRSLHIIIICIRKYLKIQIHWVIKYKYKILPSPPPPPPVSEYKHKIRIFISNTYLKYFYLKHHPYPIMSITNHNYVDTSSKWGQKNCPNAISSPPPLFCRPNEASGRRYRINKQFSCFTINLNLFVCLFSNSSRQLGRAQIFRIWKGSPWECCKEVGWRAD